MSTLSAVFYELGRYEDAMVLREKSLEFFRRVLPENHPNIGATSRFCLELCWRLTHFIRACYDRSRPGLHSTWTTSGCCCVEREDTRISSACSACGPSANRCSMSFLPFCCLFIHSKWILLLQTKRWAIWPTLIAILGGTKTRWHLKWSRWNFVNECCMKAIHIQVRHDFLFVDWTSCLSCIVAC